MDNPIIEVSDLVYFYDDEDDGSDKKRIDIPAINGISFSVNAGEYIAVLGHNGSGKSTLAKLLNLILTPTTGKIVIDGTDITSDNFWNGSDADENTFNIRKKIGMVFQNPDNQLVATVVEEDVAFGPENLGLPREVIRSRIDSALSLVGMAEYARHAPHKLSGGQKQRVAIAGIIAMKPRVIIFDESTAMLDPLGRREVIEIMEKLNREENITVLNITHYMDEAARADRVMVVNDGKLILDGSAKEVFAQTELLHSVGLEAPQERELTELLRRDGYEIDSDILSADECFDAIIKLLKK